MSLAIENLEELKKKRSSLNVKIYDYVKKNKDAYNFVIEHAEITARMQSMGSNVRSVADYLLVENWENGGKYFHLRGSNPSPSKDVQKPESKSKVYPTKREDPVENKTHHKEHYTLCLGWVSTDTNEPDQIKKVKAYLNELGLPILGQSSTETPNGFTEHILKYEFSGSDDSFRLLKICTQFVLDTFAQSDFDKFNIAVWGKKMKK